MTTEQQQQLTDTLDANKALVESNAALVESTRRLAARLLRMEAGEAVVKSMDEQGLRDPGIRARVQDGVLNSIPTTEAGDIDQTKLTALVKSVAETELGYLRGIAGVGTAVADLGAAETDSGEVKEGDLQAVFQGPGYGMTEAAAKVAAQGR